MKDKKDLIKNVVELDVILGEIEYGQLKKIESTIDSIRGLCNAGNAIAHEIYDILDLD